MNQAQFGVGIIGAGLIGQKRLEACPDEFAVRAVYDIDADRAALLAARAPTAVCARSVGELLDRDDIDVVVVATTHDQLAPLALAAVHRRKHVVVEKPAARSADELRPLRDAAAGAGVGVRVGYNHRFHPGVMRAKSIVDCDEHGRLLWIRGRYGHGGRQGYDREWRADPSVSGGGELIDQGSHLIDLVRFFFGDVALAFAHLPTLFWPMEVEDNAFLALRPLRGGMAWLHASWSDWKNTFSLEICLERAKIELTGLGGSYGVERLTLYEMSEAMGPPMTTTWEWPFPDSSWSAEMSDIAGALRGEPASGAGVDDAIAVLDVIGSAYRLADRRVGGPAS